MVLHTDVGTSLCFDSRQGTLQKRFGLQVPVVWLYRYGASIIRSSSVLVNPVANEVGRLSFRLVTRDVADGSMVRMKVTTVDCLFPVGCGGIGWEWVQSTQKHGVLNMHSYFFGVET